MVLYKNSKTKFNLELLDYLDIIMRNEIEDLFHILPNDFKQLYFEYNYLLEEELNSIELYEETIEVLESLKENYQLYLISNLASPYKKAVQKLNLAVYFDGIVFSCEEGKLKPEKNIFEIVEFKSEKKENEILMVGDSFKSDIQGAKNMNWNYLKINRKGKIKETFEIINLREIIKN